MWYINGRVESLPLTDMRYINGWVVKFSPSPRGEGLFPYFGREDGANEKNRILYYKGQVFEDMPDPYLKGNKGGNRPHYYCFEDNATGIYWMISLFSRIDKFRKIIEKKEQSGKPCDILHIVKLDDSRESVFLIQDMFPITEEYIEREYTIAGNHLMLTSEHTAKAIEQKARKVLGMLKRGVKFMPTQPDVISILEKLKQEK
ncbi:MAG: type III toxin-antitoxin system CptIN family toxin [Enterocloster sp.]